MLHDVWHKNNFEKKGLALKKKNRDNFNLVFVTKIENWKTVRLLLQMHKNIKKIYFAYLFFNC
jgi:hypothetical protein